MTGVVLGYCPGSWSQLGFEMRLLQPSLARLSSAVQGPCFGESFFARVACVVGGGLFPLAGSPKSASKVPVHRRWPPSLHPTDPIPLLQDMSGAYKSTRTWPQVREKSAAGLEQSRQPRHLTLPSGACKAQSLPPASLLLPRRSCGAPAQRTQASTRLQADLRAATSFCRSASVC